MITNFNMVQNKNICSHAPGHHGEFIQGIFRQKNGEPINALITLRVPQINSKVIFEPSDVAGLYVIPPTKIRSLAAAKKAAIELNCPNIGGKLIIKNNSQEGFGLGSSTSDIVASILSICRFLKKKISPQKIVQIAIEVEKASDSIMFTKKPILFSSRLGVVVEKFVNKIPPFILIGTQCRKSGVDTLQIPTPPLKYLDKYDEILDNFRYGINNNNLNYIGQSATKSAQLHNTIFPVPKFNHILEIIEKYPTITGVQIAHSGSVLGFIINPIHSSPTINENLIKTIADLYGVLPYSFLIKNA